MSGYRRARNAGLDVSSNYQDGKTMEAFGEGDKTPDFSKRHLLPIP